MELCMAVTLGNLGGSLSVAIGCVQRSLSTWTLQEQAGDTFESILGSKVEEWWYICMVELCCGYLPVLIRREKGYFKIDSTNNSIWTWMVGYLFVHIIFLDYTNYITSSRRWHLEVDRMQCGQYNTSRRVEERQLRGTYWPVCHGNTSLCPF